MAAGRKGRALQSLDEVLDEMGADMPELKAVKNAANETAHAR